MMTILIILAALNLILLVMVLFKTSGAGLTEFKEQFKTLGNNQERTERIVREDISKNREELAQTVNSFRETMGKQLLDLTKINEDKMEKMREVIEKRLEFLQDDNNKKLEQMRETVDEKLHSTLEKRLGESFKIVSERLEKVHQGLGEMQNLASGVGDLKKILTNVKTRGTWGEVQLGALLDQLLTSEQYEQNVVTKKGSKDPVEFAIKLPGRNSGVVYLPIDAKFPREDYDRLVEAQENADKDLVEEAGKALEARIKMEAKKIKEKYIDPPHTTDFGVLYLPTEGLYAEVIRRPGLFETLQRESRITLTGPTTIAALLNSLQMGFRTLAVEKRASEVWTLLGTVKTEFGKFGDILDKTHKKLQEASHSIEDASRKTRTIESKLKKVQELPSGSKPLSIEQQVDIDAIAE